LDINSIKVIIESTRFSIPTSSSIVEKFLSPCPHADARFGILDIPSVNNLKEGK